jgi:hypothetical protein
MLTLGADWSTDNLFSDARVTGSAAVMCGRRQDQRREICRASTTSRRTAAGTCTRCGPVRPGGKTHATVRAGVLDLNAEFDAPETLGLFVAAWRRYRAIADRQRGPSIWPLTGLGTRRGWILRSGVALRRLRRRARQRRWQRLPDLHVSSREGAVFIGELAYSSERTTRLRRVPGNTAPQVDRIDADLLTNPQPEHCNQGFLHADRRAARHVGDAKLDGALRVGVRAAIQPVDHYVGRD